MSTLTTNYNLIKPSLTDVADITAMNPNWDTIDGMLGVAKSFQTVDITSGSDLNSFTDTKFYRCKTNAIAATLSNSPTTNAFSLIILPHTNNGVCQIITEYMTSGAKQYRRNLHNGTWGAWITIATGSDLEDLEARIDSAKYDAVGQEIDKTYIKNAQINGTTVTYTRGDGSTYTQTTRDTTYSVATPDAAGLMSAADKTKLDSLRVSDSKLELKSYIGTGLSGVTNPNSITFSFAPKAVVFLNYTASAGGSGSFSTGSVAASYLFVNMDALTTNFSDGTGPYILNTHSASQFHSYAKKSADGQTLSWYVTIDSCSVEEHRIVAQLNSLGFQYTVLAIR